MKHLVVFVGLVVASAPAAGCSGDRSGSSKTSTPPGDAGGARACTGPLRSFSAPDAHSLGAGQLLLTASGESLAQTGYNFPDTPANGVFADGWEVRFSHFIATLDRVVVSANPDKVPTDQSQTDGPVAEVDGPWVLDLARPTPGDIPGKESGATATPFGVLTGQNLVDGNPKFATDGTKYAIGFSSVAASACAIDVNLDEDGQRLYGEMVAKGCTVLYTGTATFKADPAACTEDPGYLPPHVVGFSFCFRSPTDYVDCDNQETKGNPFGAEPYPRGIVFPTNRYVTGEVTMHTDHPFWESTVHDQPAHFDAFAARVALPLDGGETGTPSGDAGGDAGVPTVTLEDVAGVDYLGVTDKYGNPLRWRSCVKDETGRQYGFGSGPMLFDAHGVPKAPAGPDRTADGLRDYYDFTTYNQSTQGHWNGSDGLCFVKRNYPSPD
jgi:hypothetical protein